MNTFGFLAALALIVSFVAHHAVAQNATLLAVDMNYTAETGEDRAVDSHTDNGAQDGVFAGAVTVKAADAANGERAFEFKGPGPSVIRIPGSARLGSRFTLAAHIRPARLSVRQRLFSSYKGRGPVEANELLVDLAPAGRTQQIRVFANGRKVEERLPADAFENGWCHVAVVRDEAKLRVYIDGQLLASAEIGTGADKLAADLVFGEDVGGTVVEQFTGLADDLLVMSKALGDNEIKPAAKRSAKAAGPTPERAAPAAAAKAPARAGETAGGVINIGSRRELFVDDYLIDSFEGGAKLVLQRPVDKGVVMVCDKPWEGNTSGYNTVFRDGDIYRMYYRGWHHPGGRAAHPNYACYVESKDGVHWTRPELGIVEFDGSKKNNITLGDTYAGHNFVPFKDGNPKCKPEEQYKAVGGSNGGRLYGYVSPDGLNWQKVQEDPIIRDGRFDSQNLVYWDDMRKEYRAYYREFKDGVRDIKTAISKDFVNWTPGEWLQYPDAPVEQLYTNQISAYQRAPHIFIGFPSRLARGSNVEGLFMTSRDGKTFRRWGQAIVRAGQNKDKWGNRSNYIWYGIVETQSDLPGNPPELSIYSGGRYYRGEGATVYRHTYRLDGFASLNAPLSGGSVTTKPFIFKGTRLHVNYSTAAAGSIRVHVLDEHGKPAGLNPLNLWGDATGQELGFKLDGLEGKPIRLKFELRDADLFSFRFE
jgi:hypothetical protein